MRYQGSVYRPPSEANSLILQVTIGCAHNLCTFCNMYKADSFTLRPEAEVLEDLDWARANYRQVSRLFLADGDALVLSNEKLVKIMTYAKELFPELERISLYGSPKDVLRKSLDELRELRDLGLEIIYIGGESGSDQILKAIKKGVNRDQLIQAVAKIEEAGIKASVTFISGLGGKENWQDHAIETGKAISAMKATYVGLLTLMVEPGTELAHDIRTGKFKLLSPEEVLQETKLMLENIQLDTSDSKDDQAEKTIIFRSNHASNYLSLRGNLPRDKEAMILQIERAMENRSMLKDENFRLL